MTFKANNPIWSKAKRANKYAKGLFEVGKEAVKDVNENFKTAKRSGVVAKVQKVTFTGKNKGKVTGSKTVRRSARGETPQIITGELSRGTKARRKSAFSVSITNDVNHAKHLEPPARLNRPFLNKPIEKNKAKYQEIIRKSLLT